MKTIIIILLLLLCKLWCIVHVTVSCKGQELNQWWPFWKMAAILVMGQICDGPIGKNLPKGMP